MYDNYNIPQLEKLLEISSLQGYYCLWKSAHITYCGKKESKKKEKENIHKIT